MKTPKHVYAIMRRLSGIRPSLAVASFKGKPAVFRLRRDAEAAKKRITLVLFGGYWIVKVPTQVQVADGGAA